MEFQLRTATRKSLPIKMALQGVSSSGKSLGALLIAKGLGDLAKTVVIDTEQAIELYSHIGAFQVLNLSAPFSPERYISAIEACERVGATTIIIDSTSHQWNYLLQLHSKLGGNFTTWNKITPLYQSFVDKLLQSPCNIIATIRSKTNYVIKTVDNKTTVDRLGTKPIQRSEIIYEFDIVLDIDANHQARAIKDRTGLFADSEAFIIDETIGTRLLDWSNSGLTIDDVKEQIRSATSIEQLTSVYNQHPEWYKFLMNDFTKQKKLLQQKQ